VEIQYSPLDRWLRSELHALVQKVTDALETYDVLGATRPIATFVDQLSNWYLRRSRRRFWKSESDGDKNAAYATLYEALVTLSKLLSPTMPFLADALYQNLVRAVDPEAAESVHLTDWPEYTPALVNDDLNREMALVMRLASLGHAARNQAALKVRQPLAEVAFSVGNPEEAHALERYGDLLADELNVKKVRLLGSTGEVVSYTLKSLPKQLGQRFKGLFPKVAQAVSGLEPVQAAQSLLNGKPVQVEVDGETLEIQPDEVEVRAEAHPGLVVASDGPYLAALDTILTPELVQEGQAREFVRRVQDLRKQADFDIADRIRLYVQATPGLAQAIRLHQEYITGETLTRQLVFAAPPEGAPTTSVELDGEQVTFGVEKYDG
jgi:isoleucyl-tRNA synthetase